MRNDIEKKKSKRGNKDRSSTPAPDDYDDNKKNVKCFSYLDKHMKDHSYSLSLNNSFKNINTKHLQRLADVCEFAQTLQLKVFIYKLNY